MKDSTRALVKLSLAARSVDDTLALFRASFAEPITREDVERVERDMDNVARHAAATMTEDQYRSTAETACDRLARRQIETGQYCPVPRAAWLARHGVSA